METLVDNKGMAKVLNIPVSTVDYYALRKGMPNIKIGKHRRFNPEKVIKWFEKKEK